jgi:hypothetical protein
MAYPCFRCDVELVPGAKFCHACGAPTFAGGTARKPAAAAVAEEDRVRIKRDVKEAVLVPHATRMVQTVTARPSARRGPAEPPLWMRVLAAPVWRKPTLWVSVLGVAVVVGGWLIVQDVQQRAREQNEVYQVVTRLTASCYRDSRAQLVERLTKIQAAAGGQMTLLETAMLFDLIARSVPVAGGDCSRIADALLRPDRFQALLR